MPRKIIIMNNATEQMLGKHLNSAEIKFAVKAALRNAWLAAPGDVIVSRVPLGDAFLAYMTRIMGYAPGSIAVICPDVEEGEIATLNDALLLAPAMVEALAARIDEPGDWTILPCYQTTGIATLQRLIGLPDTPGRGFAEQRGTDLFNRKSHFRQFAQGARLPLPDGRIVTDPRGVEWAIAALIETTGKVIVKRDNGAGGTGNIVVTLGDTPPHPGACETLSLQNGMDALMARLWPMLTANEQGPIVVETYLAAQGAFYTEFFIHADGSHDYLNSGTIRLRPSEDPSARELFWIGLELPADLCREALANGITQARRFVDLAAAIGYRGHINIDALLTESGEIIYNEANARWGGGTVLDHLARHLLGDGFAGDFVVSSFRDVPAPPLAETVALIERAGLQFDQKRGRGIVVLAYDDSFAHQMEFLIIGRTRTELREMEATLLEILS